LIAPPVGTSGEAFADHDFDRRNAPGISFCRAGDLFGNFLAAFA